MLFVSFLEETLERGIMACVDESWQTKRSTIKERTSFIFNNELLSDVKFVVCVINEESTCTATVTSASKKAKMVIPAHKFVLAISSPVFYAMSYGQMAEATDSIELPDCDYESLLELFRYMYSDEVNLTRSNVMHVLYLAKKYMLPSLADKCAAYLRENLEASNVFSILPNARKFEEKDLEKRCWEMIEMHTEEAVTSEEFVTLEQSLVESVVKRERLSIKEVVLFKAVDHWATKESERQGITPNGEMKRRILGEEIVKAIRFPLMSQKEFVSVVFDSNILTIKEIGDTMKHYNGVSLTSPLPFKQTPRPGCFHHCARFAKLKPPKGLWKYTDSKSDAIRLTVSKAIELHGVQHFGSEGGVYTVSIEVRERYSQFSLVKQSGSYISQKDEIDDYYGFDVLFNHPAYLKEGKTYDIVSLIDGPASWYGEKGRESVESQGAKFTFSYTGYSTNGTSQASGQFPKFLFFFSC